MFSQQGLEKLNDLTTKHFQHASNHREYDALKQVLEKQNRLELLEDAGSQRIKRVQTCSYISIQMQKFWNGIPAFQHKQQIQQLCHTDQSSWKYSM